MDENTQNNDNLIVELSSVTEDTLYNEDINETKEEIKIKPKKSKKKKEFFFKRLTKKGKIIVIALIVVLILLIVSVVLYFCVFKKDKTKEAIKENIVVESENYIYDNGTLRILDSKDNELGSYKCKTKDAKKCLIAKMSNEDNLDNPRYQDQSGKELVRSSKVYLDKYVFISDGDEIVLYNLKNNKSLGKYKLIKIGNIEESYVVVKDSDDKYGILDLSNEEEVKEVLPCEYEYLAIGSSSEKFISKSSGSETIVNTNGEVLYKTADGVIKSFDDKYIAVYKDSSYYLYNYNTENVITDPSDYIAFEDGYVFVINSKKLYIYDSDLIKVNLDYLKLKNTYYRSVYVFDDNNTLKETKKAYTTVINADSIKIDIDESTSYTVNLNEYRLNKNYSYVSYYNGILYFFSDAEKKTSLGKYSCVYKNTVTSESEKFENCFVAEESSLLSTENSGFAPIINGSYVFINDTKEGASNKNIILYNLTGNNDSIPKYQKIDTGLGNGDVSSVTVTNNLVTCINSKGNMGIITFGQNGPSGLIAFQDSDNGGNTKTIKYFNDEYLLVTRSEGNYLYTKLGSLVASSKFEIVSLEGNYLITKNTNKFNINAIKEGKTIGSEFDYIKIYDEYYVGIKNNKLNLYSLSENGKALLSDGLEITTAKDDSYTIKETTSGITITINNVEYEYDSDYKKVEKNEEEE